MTFPKYEGHLYELDKYTTPILEIEYHRDCCHIKELRLHIHMSTQGSVIMGRFLAEVSDHDRVMKEMHYEGYYKRPSFHGRFSRCHYSSRLRDDSSLMRYPPCPFYESQSHLSRLVQSALKILDGGKGSG